MPSPRPSVPWVALSIALSEAARWPGGGFPESSMLNSDAELAALSEVNASASGPKYYADMLRLKLHGYQEMFCGLSKDKKCETLEGYPGSDSYNALTWAEVVEKLQEVPMLQEAGEITRGNELGYLILNSGLWARDYKTIGLGVGVDDHKWFRPLGDKILGKDGYWSKDTIDAHLASYLNGKTTIDTNAGVFFWTTRLMHKIHFNMDLSDEDTRRFMALQNEALVKMVLPYAVAFSGLQDERDYFLNKYIQAIEVDKRNVLPKDVTAERKKFMASSFMDSMLFAGGLSVGNVIKTCLAVLYADNSPWKIQDKQLNDDNIDQFIFEVIRRYPVVVGFPWHTKDGKKRIIMNLAMALRDKKVWGQDALDFKLRKLEDYQRLSRVAWAEPANGPEAWSFADPGRTGHLTPMSRGCPGQALSFEIVRVFLKRWAPTQSQWAVVKAPKGGLEFTDATPFVGDVTLATRVKAGLLTMVKTNMIMTKFFGYKSEHVWAVLTAGDAQQSPMLLLYEREDYPKDDPSKATAISLRDVTQYKLKNTEYASVVGASARCFKLYANSDYRFCVGGTDDVAKNTAERDAWLNKVLEQTTLARP